MTEEIPTKEKLAQALEALNDGKLKRVIRLARRGYYDDFESPLATPELELFSEMHARGYTEFCKRIVAGEFDATKEESDRWANSIDGLETFDDPEAVRGAYQIALKVAMSQGMSVEEFDKSWKDMLKERGLTQ